MWKELETDVNVKDGSQTGNDRYPVLASRFALNEIDNIANVC